MTTKIAGNAGLDFTDRNTVAWNTKAIGEPFFLWDNLTGVTPPPTTKPEYFRFIKLTASDTYNTGFLITETVSGSAPTVTATAVVNMPGSPMHGAVVRLVNTENRFLRAGSSGTLEDSQNISHSHTASSGLQSATHTHTGYTSGDGQHAHSMGAISTTALGGGQSYAAATGVEFGQGLATFEAGYHSHSIQTYGESANHNHAITVNAAGGTEVKVRNIAGTVYMRIY